MSHDTSLQKLFLLNFRLFEDTSERACRHIFGMIGNGGITVPFAECANTMGAPPLAAQSDTAPQKAAINRLWSRVLIALVLSAVFHLAQTSVQTLCNPVGYTLSYFNGMLNTEKMLKED